MKLRRWHWSDDREFGWAHWCPGCKAVHTFAVDTPQMNGARWAFDGNVDKPTFNPSMLITINAPGHPNYQPGAMSSTCHYFLHEGMIQFLGDCTHELKGQTVPMVDFPEGTF